MLTENDKKIRSEFVDFEYQGVACLCDYLANKKENNTKAEEKQRHKRLAGIRFALRNAYTVSGKGKLHNVPPALMADEQETICKGVEYTRDNYKNSQSELKNVSLIYIIDTSNIQIKKPVPVLPQDGSHATIQERFLGLGRFPKEPKKIAHDIVAFRFKKTGESVRKELSTCPKPLCTPAPLAHRLLATCFLEMCFYKNMKMLAKILDALYVSAYPKFKLYYLIQWSHRINIELCLTPWENDEIEKLCRIVNPNNATGPFSKLV